MLHRLKSIKLHWQILIALVIAALFGIFCPHWVEFVSWTGTLFLRALNMIVVPLIFTSVVCGVSSMGSGENLKRLGFKTLSFYLITSLLAAITGLLLVNLIQPGVGAQLSFDGETPQVQANGRDIAGIFIRMVPENIFKAFANADILAIIFFAIFFGFFMTRLGEKKKASLLNFFDATYDVIMKMTMFIIRFTPIGIFGIVSKSVADNSNQLQEMVGSLAWFVLTVFIALTIHALLTMPAIVKFIGRAKPYKHLQNMTTSLLTAFSTSSSSATLPLTLESVEHKSGVSNKIASFTLPLGATVNMNGTALYECTAAIFIAQAYGIDLSFSQQVVVVITALLTSIGSAGIPMAGLVMITIILNVVGLPLEGVGLILAVERILDMMRTAINVWGDSCCAVVVAKSEGEETLV
ncbi:MAG: dicarboxylate/amino acid:cation symporter [Mangrovibacterium sp.]